MLERGSEKRLPLLTWAAGAQIALRDSDSVQSCALCARLIVVMRVLRRRTRYDSP